MQPRRVSSCIQTGCVGLCYAAKAVPPGLDPPGEARDEECLLALLHRLLSKRSRGRQLSVGALSESVSGRTTVGVCRSLSELLEDNCRSSVGLSEQSSDPKGLRVGRLLTADGVPRRERVRFVAVSPVPSSTPLSGFRRGPCGLFCGTSENRADSRVDCAKA